MDYFNFMEFYKYFCVSKKEPIKKDLSDGGILYALCAKGVQDKQNNKKLFNIKSDILTGLYQYSYRKLNLNCLKTELEDGIKVTYTFKKEYIDLVNNIDIAIPDLDNLNNFIKSIKIYFNDKLVDNIDTKVLNVLNTNSILFRRPINIIKNKVYIPLTMASIQKNNLIMQRDTKYFNLSFEIIYDSFMSEYIDQVDFFGNIYVLDKPARDNLIYNSHEFSTIQNKQNNNIIHYGTNKIELKFNLQLPLIYFWGFDITKVTNIKLLLNERPYYDGTVEELMQEANNRNYKFKSPLCELIFDSPLCIFFSPNEIEEYTNSTLNSSLYNKIHLVIETTDTEDKCIYINALNLNTIIYNYNYNYNYGVKFI
jgi:hypothetical protein